MDESVMCAKHLIKNGLLPVGSDSAAADAYWESDLGEDCEVCAGYDDCSVIASQDGDDMEEEDDS